MAAADLALFDLEHGRLKPTVHCYALKDLQAVIDRYGLGQALEVFKFLYYMCSQNAKDNPFFDAPEHEKESLILSQLDCSAWSSEDDEVQNALLILRQLFSTPTSRAYRSMKVAMDNVSDFMENTPVTTGRDGNLTPLVNAMQKFDQLRQSFKGVFKDLQEEQQAGNVRGGGQLAYDQR